MLPVKFQERLKELSELEQGWYDGDCDSITKCAIETTRTLLTELQQLSNINENIRIYPTHDAGISIITDVGELSLILEVRHNGMCEVSIVQVSKSDAAPSPIFIKILEIFLNNQYA